MLFDLQGKRKRLVQVIYAMLAVLMGSGLVLFGIGGSGSGLLDSIGIGGGSANSTTSGFDDRATTLEHQLRRNPQNQQLLLQLARLRFLAGNTEVQAHTDPTTGQQTITDTAINEFDKSASAWERYLKTKPKQPDVNVAAVVVQAYQALNDAHGAATTEKLVVAKHPSTGGYANLALFLYADGNFAEGDAAASKAESLAPKSKRPLVRQQLAQLKIRAKKFVAQQKKAEKAQKATGQNPLQSPLGPLGGGSSGTP
jgi:tetratricopeptide (TPR) repeat protein